MRSIWHESCALPQFPALRQDIAADIVIIGGGLAGLLCAWQLEQRGADYVLIESDQICGGVSGNTTAKITAQHGLCYHKLVSRFGPETAYAYYQANTQAIAAYRQLAETIDCDFQTESSYCWNSRDPEALVREQEALEQLGIPFRFVQRISAPVECQAALGLDDQAQFHPLQFAATISRGLRIYEHTPARQIGKDCVQTDGGRVHGKQIIVATHFPIVNRHGGYFVKMYQQRSYVLALENGNRVKGMYLDEATDGVSLRMAGDKILLGGGGHRTGKRGGGWRFLEQVAAERFPNANIAARWATQDCMSLDGVPYIGTYSPGTEKLFVATGFGKWGMTTAMAGAFLLADLAEGKENPYQALFDPSRSILRPQLLVNGLETALNLLRPTAPRCTHLGCALHWNAQERSWDCSCHGSRFDGDGQLLENPAQKNLKRK